MDTSPSTRFDNENIKKLGEIVNGHPLSLRLLGGLFNSNKEPINKFINNVHNRLRDAEDSLEGRHRSINACIQYSFDCLDVTLQSMIGQLRLFDTPFTSTLATRV